METQRQPDSEQRIAAHRQNGTLAALQTSSNSSQLNGGAVVEPVVSLKGNWILTNAWHLKFKSYFPILDGMDGGMTERRND